MIASLVRHGGLALAGALLVGCMGPRVGENRSSIIEDGPECVGARSPGFWCENQDGKNPNLTAEERHVLDEAGVVERRAPEHANLVLVNHVPAGQEVKERALAGAVATYK